MRSCLKRIACSLLVAAPMLGGGVDAFAQSVVSSGESFVDLRLVAGRAEADGSRTAGLVVEVAPEWKTYWRNPGVAGIPPKFDWAGSRNLAKAEISWPRPAFFQSFGLETLGYAEQVVFPVRLVPANPAQALDVHLEVALGVCREICVLEETTLSARIEPGAPAAEVGLVAAAEALVPRSGAKQGLVSAGCRISGTGKTRQFEAKLAFDAPLAEPRVILEGPDLTWFTGTKTEVGRGTGEVTVTASLKALQGDLWVNRSDIRMTVLAGAFAADVQGCSAPAG